MPMQINEENVRKVLAIHVSGKLVKTDYERFVPASERFFRQHGKLRALFAMSNFRGWDAGAAWEDFKFGVEPFADIQWIAMVGEEAWQHGMATFSKPFTKATVRWSDGADVAEARTWLKA